MEERPDAEHDDGVEPGHGEDDEDDEDERKSSTDAHAPLSKNARKRLLKEQQKDQRKAHRKAEKKIRKQQRAERSVNGDCGGPENGTPNDTVAGAVSTSATALALPPPPSSAEERREVIWAAWKRWGSPKLVLAPMVNQSELAFRLLARHHGARLTYTPMLHSRLFAAEEAYRLENFDEHASDRPLVAQFCGDDPATLVAAARLIQHRCDAVDLNCGCPQGIARRGHYGAFLLDEPDLIESIVRALSSSLSVPVFVKIRLLPSALTGAVDVPATVALAQRLEAAGCSLLTVHGRTRAQKCSCESDWRAIGAIKAALRIPVLANGGVERPEDLGRCLAATGADGIMSSEGALENPSILSGVPTCRMSQVAVALEYVELARRHPPRAVAVLKAHFFKMLFMALELHKDMRERLGSALDAEGVFTAVREICSREEAAAADDTDGALRRRCDEDGAPFQTWYRRHRGETAADPNRYGLFVPPTERPEDDVPSASAPACDTGEGGCG